MRFVIGTDEDRPVIAFIASRLREKGHDVTILPIKTWAAVAQEVARAVARHEADQGIVCCWTGTGASIAANKIEGVRAALCGDAQTAAGARRWNDANVLALSLRLLSEPIAAEILDAWLAESYGGTENDSLALLR